MSDSSGEEDMTRFRDVVDASFTAFMHKPKEHPGIESRDDLPKHKSERYLDIASHYNDVKVPKELQRQIANKISLLINKNVEFVNVEESKKKKRKIKGGVKLFKDSPEYLTCEAATDVYTELHNKESKNMKRMRRRIDPEEKELDENEKISAAMVTGDYVISKEETQCWKSRRKEKLFKYKSQGKGKMLVSID